MVLAHHEIVARLESLQASIKVLYGSTHITQDINKSIDDLINEIRGQSVENIEAGLLYPRTQRRGDI